MASKNPIRKVFQTIQGYIEMFPVIAYGAYLNSPGNSFNSLAPSIFFALISVIFVVPAVAFILRFGAQLFKDQELTIENALLPASANCYGTVFGENQLGRELLEAVDIDLSKKAENVVLKSPSLIFIMGGLENAKKIFVENAVKSGEQLLNNAAETGSEALGTAVTMVGNVAETVYNAAKESGKNMFTRLSGGGTNQPTLSNDTRQKPLSHDQLRPDETQQSTVQPKSNTRRWVDLQGKLKSKAGKESVGRRLKQKQGEVGKSGILRWFSRGPSP
ncbi:MAG: hypothetical protein VXW87_05115 [Pseudomonadota bacterium]|nr:hypothetical protein [Pseudomonadota bacterium]